jgi:SPP1 gp7 family putative phage head morphogenesis protein
LRDDLVREVVARFRRLAERIEKMFPHFFPEVAGLATHGGAGSGNFGHAGRPGEVGGSGPWTGKVLYADEEGEIPGADQAWEIAKKSGINILSDKELTAMAYEGKKVVGALFTSLVGGEFSFDIVVDPKAGGKGIGTRLAQEGLRAFREVEEMGAVLKLDVVSPTMERILQRLGLKVSERIGEHVMMGYAANSLVTNAPGDFNRNPSKTQMFLDWLKEVEEEEGGVAEKGWLDDALAGAMARGSRQAIGRLRGSKFGKRLPADDAQASAMLGATAGMRDRAEMLFTRAYGDLKGVTAKMDAQIGRIMAEGVMAGKNPKAIARELANEVEGMTLPRARTLARTEIVRAHHVATIQSYRELGVVGVEVVAEWLTSGLDNVCEECEELEGKQFTLDAIENMIPLHPNCKCTCVPVVEEPSEDLRDEAPARTEWDEEQEEPAEPLSEANPEIRDMSAEELADYAPAEEFDLGDTPLLLQREVVEGLDAALPAGADVQLDAVRLEGGELMRGSYAGYAESQGKREILLTPDLPWLAGEIATKHEKWQERKGFTSKAASRKEGRSWRWSTAMDSPAPVRDLTLHEASHALFEQNGEVAMAFLKKVRTEYDAYDDVMLKDKVLRRDARYVSEAAVEDEGELFAEVSTLMLGGREKQVPAKLRTAWEAAREVVKGESK